MREKTVEKRLHDEIKKIGGRAYKLSAAVDAGMPDRLVCFPGGRLVFVETKRPVGGRLSKMQAYRHAELRRMGFEVRVVNTTELVMEFIAECRRGENAE